MREELKALLAAAQAVVGGAPSDKPERPDSGNHGDSEDFGAELAAYCAAELLREPIKRARAALAAEGEGAQVGVKLYRITTLDPDAEGDEDERWTPQIGVPEFVTGDRLKDAAKALNNLGYEAGEREEPCGYFEEVGGCYFGPCVFVEEWPVNNFEQAKADLPKRVGPERVEEGGE